MWGLDIFRKISIGVMNLFHLLLSGLGFLALFAYGVFFGLMAGIGLGVSLNIDTAAKLAITIMGTFAVIIIVTIVGIFIVIIPYWGFSLTTAMLAICHKKPSKRFLFSILNSLIILVFALIVSGAGLYAVISLGFDKVALIIGVGIFILFGLWAPLNIVISIIADVPLMGKGNVEKEFPGEESEEEVLQ